ncbi:MAG: secretin N-terminal domain-containing protein, partial [Nitrospinaceae bacterium]
MRRGVFLALGVWLSGAGCATLDPAETIDGPRPLESNAGSPKAGAEASAFPGLQARELLLPQTEITPHPQAKPLPAPPAEAMPEPVPSPVERHGPLFSLSAQDASLKAVLLALSQEIPQNIIIDPAVNQKVTVDLKEVSLQEVLDNLLKPLELVYRQEGNFIHVMPERMETRMFRLNYIISRRQGASNLQSTSGQGVAGTSGDSSSTSSTSSFSSTTGATGASGSNQGGSGRTFTNLFTSEETDLWREIFFGLQRIVTGGGQAEESSATTQTGAAPLSGIGGATAASTAATPGEETGSPVNPDELTAAQSGYFTINRQAGLVIIRDYPENLLQAAEFLEAVEGSAQRQVFILAKILEVNLTEEYRLGVDWSQVSPLRVINDTERGVTQQFDSTFTTFNLARNTDAPLGAFLQGSSGFFFGVSNTQINVLIDALSEQGTVSVLSSPKIATLNNQRAVIKVGTEDVFFIPEVVPATTTSASVTQFIPSSLTIGIVLDVLPQINKNGQVMMSINTSISERAGERISPDGLNAIPILDVRESNSVVLANSGQTIVIGGLMKTKKTNNENEVPFLGKLPFLGRLFQHTEDLDEKTELVIMLTPQVM